MSTMIDKIHMSVLETVQQVWHHWLSFYQIMEQINILPPSVLNPFPSIDCIGLSHSFSPLIFHSSLSSLTFVFKVRRCPQMAWPVLLPCVSCTHTNLCFPVRNLSYNSFNSQKNYLCNSIKCRWCWSWVQNQ